jgi:hypothetical protein
MSGKVVNASDKGPFKSFAEFYPFYLQEHIHPTNRALHFVGTTLVILSALVIIYHAAWSKLWVLPTIGYGFAWLGHFFFEKNKPATFKHPLYSLAGDFCMWFDLLTGKLRLNGANMSWSPRAK